MQNEDCHNFQREKADKLHLAKGTALLMEKHEVERRKGDKLIRTFSVLSIFISSTLIVKVKMFWSQ
jgi:hypothetical protein